MSQYIRRIGTPLALTLALMSAACGTGGDDSDTALAQDSTLNRDLQLAQGDTAAQPQLSDVPAPAEAPAPAPNTPTTTRPRTTRPPATRPSTPAPTPKATEPERTASGNTVTSGEKTSGGGAVGMVAAGTTMSFASASKVCTNTNKVGDRITATLNEAVTGTNGAVIPAGAAAVIEITKLKRSENANDNIEIGFAVRSISFGGTSYNVDADVTAAAVERTRSATKSDDAKKVIGGAVIGAVIGQVIGKDAKGTVIGAATGAAAGTAAAAATANYDGCVNDGGRITIKLTSPLSIKA